MPKIFFCSTCGTLLTHIRKGLKNRGEILNLIAPHECDLINVSNIVDSDKPTKNAVREVESTEVTGDEKKALSDVFDLGPGDKRNKKDIRKSSGDNPIGPPSSVKKMIKDENNTSEPEGGVGDL